MSTFPNWQEYVVAQRRPNSGCIPTGYEMLLRAANVKGIDFSTVQEDFDFDKNLQNNDFPKNNFELVANAINERYSHVHFRVDVFSKGAGLDKLHFVENSINHQQLVLISLNMQPVLKQP